MVSFVLPASAGVWVQPWTVAATGGESRGSRRASAPAPVPCLGRVLAAAGEWMTVDGVAPRRLPDQFSPQAARGGPASSRRPWLVVLFFLVAVGLGVPRFSGSPLLLFLFVLVLYRVAGAVLPHVDGWLLSAVGGRLVDEFSAPQVHNVVEEVCIAAGLEKPRIAVIDDPALNAFAHKGRRPEKNTIFFTTGLLEALDRDELQGVVAHELADLVYGPLGYLEADDVAVHMTRNPSGLRRALERIASGSSVVRRSPRRFRSLWFEYPSPVRPVDKHGASIVPPLTDRIAAVAELEGVQPTSEEAPASGEDARFIPTPAFLEDRFSDGSALRLGLALFMLIPGVFVAVAAYMTGGFVLWIFATVVGVVVWRLLGNRSPKRPTARG